MNKKIIITISTILGLTVIVGCFLIFQKTRNQGMINNQQKQKVEVVENNENESKQKTENQEKKDNQNNQEKVEELKIEDIDTSNWKTYRNEEYGFSFKYPEGWVIKESPNANTFLFKGLSVKVHPKEVDKYNRGLFFNINVFKSESNPKVWYQTKYENPDAIKGYKGETKELKINNLDAYYVVDNKVKDYKDISYLISKNNIIIYSTFRSERNYGSKGDFSYEKYIPYFKSLVYSIK